MIIDHEILTLSLKHLKTINSLLGPHLSSQSSRFSIMLSALSVGMLVNEELKHRSLTLNHEF